MRDLNIGQHLFPRVPELPPEAIAALGENIALQQLLSLQLHASVEQVFNLLQERKFEEAYGELQSVLKLIDLKAVMGEARSHIEQSKVEPKRDPYKLNNRKYGE